MKVERLETPDMEPTWTGAKGERSISSFPEPVDGVDTSLPAAARPSTSAALLAVEGRDRAVLAQLQQSRTGRTTRELKGALPDDSEAAIEAALTRLRIKGFVQRESTGNWTTV